MYRRHHANGDVLPSVHRRYKFLKQKLFSLFYQLTPNRLCMVSTRIVLGCTMGIDNCFTK